VGEIGVTATYAEGNKMQSRKQRKMREANTPLIEAVGFLLEDAARLMTQAFSKRLAPHGIALGVFPFLRALWEQDGLTQAELANRVGRKGPTAVTALRQMERDGMIRRVADKTDKRKAYVYLTTKGRALYTRAIPNTEAHMKRCLAGFTQEEREMFKTFLRRFRANLQVRKRKAMSTNGISARF
jgi:DNA-binding MarR family transcriptional regulator